jgi:hypothetical protein
MNSFIKITLTVTVIVIVAIFIIPISVIFRVHYRCRSVRNAIISSDVSLLNDWAIKVYKGHNTASNDPIKVDPNEYCEVIRNAKPSCVVIDKDNEKYSIYIYLTGAFVPSSVSVAYEKGKTNEQCVKMGR